MCFWGGGADVQRVLPLGTPEEVRRDARRRMEVLARTGGFVFAPIHNLQADVPPENIAAMYEEASCNWPLYDEASCNCRSRRCSGCGRRLG